MLISWRLEEQISCCKGIHSALCAEMMILELKYHQKRYKCSSCLFQMKSPVYFSQCQAIINEIQAIQDQLYLRISLDVLEYAQQLELFWKNLTSKLDEKENLESQNLIKQWIINLIDIAEECSIYSFYNEAEELCKCFSQRFNIEESSDFYFEIKRTRLIEAINQCNLFFASKLQSILNRNQLLQSEFQKKASSCFENLQSYSQKKISNMKKKRAALLDSIKISQDFNLGLILMIYKDKILKLTDKIAKSKFNFIIDINQKLNLFNFKIVYQNQYHQIQRAQQLVKIKWIQENIKQLKGCLAISFNYDDTLMAAGCENDIRLYRFENGLLLDSIVDLQGHNDFVYCLTFSHQYNWLASGGKDGQLILWKQISQFNWIQTNKNIEHPILCLIMNNNEEQLISGNQNGQIHIWQIQYVQNFFKIQQIISMNQTSILSISINEQGTQFVMCTLNNQIILYFREQENFWKEQQKLNSGEDTTIRIIFVDDQTIISQSFRKHKLNIFILEGNLFTKSKSIELNGTIDFNLFPICYNRLKKTLIIKQDQVINFIICKEQDFILQESKIEMNNDRFFGSLSQGGKYLVLWYMKTRKFKNFELIYPYK